MRRGRLALLAAALLAVAPAGAQAASWNYQQTPQTNDATAAVACVTAGSCFGAGTFRSITGGPVKPSFETYSGSWATTATVLPVGATSGQLAGISCPTAGTCVAVGSYVTSGGVRVTLAQGFVRGVWSTVATPNPAGARSAELRAVSCASVSDCIAVGTYTDSGGVQRTLAESWNGTVWSLQVVPNPVGTNPVLNAVSCGVTGCTAVGAYTDASLVQRPLAARWNGTTWALQTVPSPAGARAGELRGVACPAATTCIAVGSYVDSGGVRTPLAESWNGTTWALGSAPSPVGAVSAQLNAVACLSTTACTAVGGWNDGTSNLTLAEGYTGGWAVQSTPASPGYTSPTLTGVACAVTGSFTLCNAVGAGVAFGAPKSVALRSVNGTWATVSAGGTDDRAHYVSCTASNACTAVGRYTDPSAGTVPFAERWNGSTWSLQSMVVPAGSTFTVPRDAVCVTSTYCVAAGWYTNATADVTLVEVWNGSSWSIQSTPNVAGASQTILFGVSCTSTTACTAVGNAVVGTVTSPIALSWNGSTWSLQTPPSLAGTTNTQLHHVSCVSSSDCTAVGYSIDTATNVTSALIERWNGSSWSIVASLPAPVGSISNALYSVSCTSASHCVAAGTWAEPSLVLHDLALGWNGSSWSLLPASSGRGFNAISCASASFCKGVGSDGTVVQAWDGTSWSTESAVTFPGNFSSFTDISCPTTAFCAAQGQLNFSGQGRTMSQLWF